MTLLPVPSFLSFNGRQDLSQDPDAVHTGMIRATVV